MSHRPRFLLGLMALIASLLLALLPAAPAPLGPAITHAARDPLSIAWTSTENDGTVAITWGDVDGDGDLDLATGNIRSYGVNPKKSSSQIYRNDGADSQGNLQLTLAWIASEDDSTRSVAWGDVDGDGDLDLAVGNETEWVGITLQDGTNRIYRNDGLDAQGNPLLTLAWSASEGGNTFSVAWGDMDGDGDLDLAVGNRDQPNRLYRNDGADSQGNLQLTLAWSSSERDTTWSVAWGDADGDGDLDLAVGNESLWNDVAQQHEGGQNRLYRNDGVDAQDDPQLTLAWSSSENDNTHSVAWGDADSDGDLDLAVGNVPLWNYVTNQYQGGQNRIYRNDGVDGLGNPQLTMVWSSNESDTTTSVAWGDADNDGDLDLAVGNEMAQLHRIYRNGGVDWQGNLQLILAWSSNEREDTGSLAWGDVDGDGTLDLAVGNVYQPNRIYRNTSAVLTPNQSWRSTDNDRTSSVAWGDVDSDGDLDLAVGSATIWDNYRFEGGVNRVYRNDGVNSQGSPLLTLAWSASDLAYTNSVAWGDVDADGDLDLAVGNTSFWNQSTNQWEEGTNQIYRNDGLDGQGKPQLTLAWSADEQGSTSSVAWGDVDADGDLDLAVGNHSQPNRIYRNDGVDGEGNPQLTLAWSASNPEDTTSVAWGDADADGDLDLAIGNQNRPNQLYRNDGVDSQSNPQLTLAWSSSESDATWSVAWGDIDGDNDLDLAVGNQGRPNRLYHNDNGVLTPSAVWSSIEINSTRSVAWGDVDTDGDLDLITGNYNTPNLLYRNDQGVFTLSVPWDINDNSNTLSVALGDVDGDGDLDLAASDDFLNSVYRNEIVSRSRLVSNMPSLSLGRPGSVGDAGFYSTPEILTDRLISIPYTLRNREGDPVRQVRAEFSLDGGGSWRTAVAAAGTLTTDLATGPAGVDHTFVWDTFASGLFGQSDNVVIRMVAYPSLTTGQNGVPLFQRPYASATSFPFRVRGTQVRVVNPQGRPVADAIVLRRPAGATDLAAAYSFGEALAGTDQNGYLRGHGSLATGDTLTALAPRQIEATRPYSASATLYDTNIVSASGLGDFTVSGAGVQTITVRPTRPLLLFHLDISLEWDARGDTRYLTQLDDQLRRASELLFQATHGQAALGEVIVWHDKENWDVAHIRIYASSRLRPSASIGGVSGAVITRTRTIDSSTRELMAGPGQLQMGATWNRFGSVGDNLAEDWPRTLAHELGHYLFFLDDNYVGVDAAGRLSAVESCPGLMADPYASVELRPRSGWRPACAQTLSNQVSGVSDWETITDPDLYPFLQAPATTFEQTPSAPLSLPLDVTGISFAEPLTPTARLAAPYFYARTAAGARVVPSSRASAYLFQDSWRDAEASERDRITALGGASQDYVLARGARVGDRVCLFDPAAPIGAGGAAVAAQGCTTITPGGETIHLSADGSWAPEIQVTPVTSMTLAIQVTLPASYSGPGLQARIHPSSDMIDPINLSLTRDANAPIYRGEVTPDAPIYAASVHVWADVAEGNPARREAVGSFSLGGEPGFIRPGGGFIRPGGGFIRPGGGFIRPGGGFVRPGGGFIRPGGGFIRPGGGFIRQSGAPLASASGDVLLYGEDLAFDLGEYLVLQASDTLPAPPLWATPIGQSYVLAISAGAPDMSAVEISFSYRERDVPAGEEGGITIYYQAPGASSWQALQTTLNSYYNLAATQLRGPGRYALMSSITVPIAGPGWSMFAYPVAGQRAAADALAGIAGTYTAVYGYETQDTADPWKLYAPGAPAWANDLGQLAYGRGYWIKATEALTLPLRGASATQAAIDQDAPAPPMTLYGVVSAQSLGATPAPGLAVRARIGGVVCGSTTTRAAGGQVVYALDVPAAGELAGCGAPGALVELTIDGRSGGQAPWMSGPLRLDGGGGSIRVLLPMIQR